MFELTPQIQKEIIIGVIIVIMGGIFVAIFTYYLGKRSLRRQRFLDASREFREAFQEFIIYLDEANDIKDSYTDEDIVSPHLEASIIKHEIAYKKFLPYFGWFKALQFNRAWQQYAYPDKNKFPRDWNIKEKRFEYMEGVDWAKQTAIRKLLRKRINKLFKFANVR
jgi:hypothetical protein